MCDGSAPAPKEWIPGVSFRYYVFLWLFLSVLFHKELFILILPVIILHLSTVAHYI